MSSQIGRPRKHPATKVGDRFGSREVVRLVPRDRTSNERVGWVCDCGEEGIGYVFNLRTSARCGRCSGRSSVSPASGPAWSMKLGDRVEVSAHWSEFRGMQGRVVETSSRDMNITVQFDDGSRTPFKETALRVVLDEPHMVAGE